MGPKIVIQNSAHNSLARGPLFDLMFGSIIADELLATGDIQRVLRSIVLVTDGIVELPPAVSGGQNIQFVRIAWKHRFDTDVS